MYWYVFNCFCMYWYILVDIWYAYVCIGKYWYVFVCICMYLCVLVCIDSYWFKNGSYHRKGWLLHPAKARINFPLLRCHTMTKWNDCTECLEISRASTAGCTTNLQKTRAAIGLTLKRYFCNMHTGSQPMALHTCLCSWKWQRVGGTWKQNSQR